MEISIARRRARAQRKVVCVWLKLVDDPTQKLSSYFRPVAAIIAQAASAGCRVVVHCMMGVSRSVSLVTAYMLLHRVDGHRTLKDALDAVRTKRAVAQPQPTFCLELFKLERELSHARSVADSADDA